MSSVRIVNEEKSCLPERLQLIVPYAQTVSSKSSSQHNSSRNSLAASSPLRFDGCSFTFDDVRPISRCCSITIPVDLDDADTMVPSPCRSIDYYTANTPRTRYGHALHSSEILPSQKSLRTIMQFLHENITSVEVDERTLHCEVLEFFGLLESVCKVGVQLTMKQTTDISFSKDLLMDSFNSLKNHLKDVRENYLKLREIDKSNTLLENRNSFQNRYSLPRGLHKDSTFKNTFGSLNRSEEDVFQSHLSDSNSTSSIPRSQSYRNETDRGHLQKALRDKESECERLSVQMRTLRGQLEESKINSEKFAEIEAERANLKRASRAHKTKAERFEDEVKQLTARIKTKEEKIDQLQAELQETQSRLEHIAVDRITDFSERATLQSRISELEVAMTQLEGTHKIEVAVLETSSEDSSNLLTKLRSVNNTLNSENLNFQEKITLVEAEVRQLKQITGQSEGQVESFKAQITDRDERLLEASETINRLEVEKEVLQEKAKNFHRQLGSIQQEKLELMRILEERKVTFEKGKKAVKSKVEAALDDRISMLGVITRQSEQSLSPSIPGDGATGAETARSDTSERISDLERQLRNSVSEQNRYRLERDTLESRTLQRMKDLRERLDHSQSSNKSLQNYVDYLKKSYTGVFSQEDVLENGDNPANHHSKLSS